MPKLILTMIAVAAFFSALRTNAQVPFLSPKNTERLNQITSGKERILKYYQILKRDSLKRERQLKRKFKKGVDSTRRAAQRVEGFLPRDWEGLPDLIGENVDPLGHTISQLAKEPGVAANLDSVAEKLRLVKQLDTARNFNLPDKIPEKYGNPLKGNRFPVDLNGKDIFSDGLAPDLERNVDHSNLGIPGNFSAEIQNAIPEVAAPLRNINTDDVRDVSPDVLIDNAANKIDEELQEKLQDRLLGAQQRVGRLLSRYQSITASPDSVFGVKRKSLKGRPLKERIFVGFNLTPRPTKPFGLQVASQLGYKFNKNFVAGAGLNYMVIFCDTLGSKAERISRDIEYNLFTSITLFKSWYAIAELTVTTANRSDEIRKQLRTYECFAGIGKRFLVHPKVYFNVTLLYSVLGNKLTPDVGKFQCRVGISLSELALRKKNILYNPNY